MAQVVHVLRVGGGVRHVEDETGVRTVLVVLATEQGGRLIKPGRLQRAQVLRHAVQLLVDVRFHQVKHPALVELQRAAATSKAALVQRADHLTQEQSHAKTERDRFNDDVRSGTVRLSIPIAGGQCAATADSAAAAGHRHQTRAELDPATAAALGAIAGDGDDATRQLNACIDAYNTMRDTYHVQTE